MLAISELQHFGFNLITVTLT